MLYAPASLLTAVVTMPVAMLVAVTVAPGSTACDESSIVPDTVALLDCPNACMHAKDISNAAATKSLLMVSPPNPNGLAQLLAALVHGRFIVSSGLHAREGRNKKISHKKAQRGYSPPHRGGV